jgi:amidophosphoribosyltransferase
MCGVFGIRSSERDVARVAFYGLFALQHRGQESAGIAVSDGVHVTAMRDMGLVSQVFDERKLQGLKGEIAIGHTRYSTTGSTHWANAQPLVHQGRARTVALGHNGNITNAEDLRDQLAADGVRLRSSSDSEVIAGLIAHDEAPLEQAIANAMPRLEGAYTIVDLIGADLEREVRPGELVVIDNEGCRITQAVPQANGGALCIFELFYLARPDSQLAGVEVHNARVRMGERLAQESPAEADLVMPIPDSGTPAAIGFSRALQIPFSEGLIKNRYVGRTFIQPDQGLRDQGIKLKFNPLAEVRGRRIVVVDDSIVRGSTTRQIVAMLFEAGAIEVHVRVSSPPIVSPCFYGIDFADEDQLVAADRDVEAVRKLVGATSLAYLSLEGLQAATRRPASGFCRACLTREYPTRVPLERRLDKTRFEATARAPGSPSPLRG